MVEGMKIFSECLGALHQLHKLIVLYGHQPGRNIMTLESLLEPIPSDLGIFLIGWTDNVATIYLLVLVADAKHTPPSSALSP